MTSSADQANQISSAASPATASTPSSASAAVAVQKPESTPVVATGSTPPVVAAGSSASSSQHAKSSSVSPMNGRPNIMPAVPTVGAPAVAHGTSSTNGEAHARKPSITVSNGQPNGTGAAPKAANIQFGYDSPAASHSTPQTGSAPIPIPGGDPRVASPRNSPSPIPQPSASGGRPPSSAQGAPMTFGSFDGDRSHMRTPSMSHEAMASGSPSLRRASTHSQAELNPQAAPHGMGRGNFPQAGRGRGGYYHNQQNMGYPPNNNFSRGPPNQGRGGMPGSFNANRQHFGTPPPVNRSPAMQHAMPHQPPQGMAPPAPYYYNGAPGMPPQMPPMQQQYQPYPQANYDPRAPMPGAMPGYPYYGQPQSPAPGFQQPFVPPYPAAGQPMSRQGSQVSVDARPPSSASQGHIPAPGMGTPQTAAAQIKAPVAASPQFARPQKKNAALVIKNANGEALDVASLKATNTPATSSQPSSTPPVVASTPTPPPKPATPSHSRSDSNANLPSKSSEEIRLEFKEKMKQAAGGSKEPASSKDNSAEDDKPKPAAEETKEEEAKASKTEAPQEEAPKETKPQDSSEPTKTKEQLDEEELDRVIAEMEAADAAREAKAEEVKKQKAIEAEAKKKAEAEARVAAAGDNDRKLREQEREMERLEDEKEAKRLAAERGVSGDKAASKDNTDDAASKLANLSLDDKQTSAPKTSPASRGPKPAALNLAPLKTNSVEPPQPSAALQSLKTARLLDVIKTDMYPPGISSPNPALNAAVAKKGTSFKYDTNFLLQFKEVFTEQPSLDFHQQVKSLIGDGDGGRSASTRGPASSGRQGSRQGSNVPAMGGFTMPGGRTLPPGTTSEQRLAMSSGSISRPPVPAMGSFPGPRGSFPGGASMSRSSSTANMGAMPNSPRQGSRRNASKQSTFNAKAEAQAAKTMPLTQGMKIELPSTSSTGWKPSSIGKSAAAAASTGPDGHMDPPTVQRKVKAALNKMTPDNFDRISDQILQIAAQSQNEQDGRTLRQVIQLTFEKATDEAHWASMYAQFCNRMLEMMSPEIRDENITDRRTGQVVSGGALFRKYLLNRCQEEFERGWKMKLPEPKEGEGAVDKKTGEAALMSEEYYIAAAAKRRGLGLVQFIGELYKLGMLTERIMHECVKKLVDYQGIPEEAEVESLSKLLRTIGANLDSNERGKPMMDVYFQRIQAIIDIPDLPSRLQFMLMDVVDLRKSNWHSKEANKGPKKLEEVRAEAEAAAAAKAAEAARSNQRGGPGGRPHMGRGDARGYQNFPQPTSNQVGMDDLRRLKGGANRTSSSNMGTLGPMSMLGSRSNSGRGLGPGSALRRGGEDSGASSRTGTPPVKDQQSSTNAFSLLANMDAETPASPPSAAASPAMAKVAPDSANKDSS